MRRETGAGWFTLTFDDASRTQLELGLPTRARHGVSGVVASIPLPGTTPTIARTAALEDRRVG